jgi:hypothetical protein
MSLPSIYFLHLHDGNFNNTSSPSFTVLILLVLLGYQLISWFKYSALLI